MNNNSTLAGGVYTAAAAAVLLGFAAFLLGRALNVPYQDDILDVLNFTLRFEQAQSMKDAIALLLEQHNDHRTSASRLVFYGVYQLTGEINFRTLSLLANLAVPLFCLLYFLAVPRREIRYLSLLLATLLLCQPQAYGLLFWSMSAFAFYLVLLYGFASFYWLHQRGNARLVLAGMAACAGTFTLASGQLIWLVGCASLCWQLLRGSHRSWPDLFVWLLMGAVTLAVYYSGAPPRYTGEGVIGAALQTPLHHLAWYGVTLGSALGFSQVVVALPAGIALLLLSTWLLLRGAVSQFGPLHTFVLFLLANTLVVMLGRAPYSDLDYALAPRYSVASQHLLLSCLLLLLSQQWPRMDRLMTPLVLAAALLCGAKYWIYTPLLDEHLAWRAAEFNKGKYQVIGYPLRDTKAMVDAAINKSMYTPPSRPLKLGAQ